MPCNATMTARGAAPSASQWRKGSLAPSRATRTSPVICGVIPPSSDGAKVGAQALRDRTRIARPKRTSHLESLRQGVFIAQHQHADHQEVIDPVEMGAEGKRDAFIIEKLRPLHVQARPAAIAKRFGAG